MNLAQALIDALDACWVPVLQFLVRKETFGHHKLRPSHILFTIYNGGCDGGEF
jgi:hypothetical protein